MSRSGLMFVIIVVDGRQKGYSEGASPRDLHDIMLRLGVSYAQETLEKARKGGAVWEHFGDE